MVQGFNCDWKVVVIIVVFRGEFGVVDVDTCPSAAAVENDVVFGGGMVGVEGVNEEDEEYEEEEEEDRGEVFATANRVGKLNRFGFGETGEVVGFSERAMFGVELVAVRGEILEGSGDSDGVGFDAGEFAKYHGLSGGVGSGAG